MKLHEDVDANINIFVLMESMANAVAIAFNISITEAKKLINSAMTDERSNIMELIAEYYALGDYK